MTDVLPQIYMINSTGLWANVFKTKRKNMLLLLWSYWAASGWKYSVWKIHHKGTNTLSNACACVCRCRALGQDLLPPCSFIQHYHILLTRFCYWLPCNSCEYGLVGFTAYWLQHNTVIISYKLDNHTLAPVWSFIPSSESDYCLVRFFVSGVFTFFNIWQDGLPWHDIWLSPCGLSLDCWKAR